MRFVIRIFRGLLYFSLLTIFSLGGMVIGYLIIPIIYLFTKKNNNKRMAVLCIHFSWKIFVKAMILLGIIKISITNEDKNKLKTSKGNVIVSNHPTLIDVVILVSIIPNAICLVKEDLIKNFFLRGIISKLYIVNSLNTYQLLEKSKEALDEGFNLVIFPEGTRTDNKINNKKLHKGSARISFNNNADILPVNISTSVPFLGKNSPPLTMVQDRVVRIDIKVLKKIKISEICDIKNKSEFQNILTINRDIKNKIF